MCTRCPAEILSTEEQGCLPFSFPAVGSSTASVGINRERDRGDP